MLFDGIRLAEGTEISNMVVASGGEFPDSPNLGELFYINGTGSVTAAGLYVFDGSGWVHINESSTGGGPPLQAQFISLLGPTSLTADTASWYQITDFDSFSTYTVEVSDGIVSPIQYDSFELTAPSDPGTVTLTITKNGTPRTFEINITPAPATITKPSITQPQANQITSQTPTFVATPFSQIAHFAGQTHTQSHWQISTDVAFSFSLLENTSSSDLETWTVNPDDALAQDAEYYVRVRYYASTSGWSDWSDPVKFATYLEVGGFSSTTSVSPVDILRANAIEENFNNLTMQHCVSAAGSFRQSISDPVSPFLFQLSRNLTPDWGKTIQTPTSYEAADISARVAVFTPIGPGSSSMSQFVVSYDPSNYGSLLWQGLLPSDLRIFKTISTLYGYDLCVGVFQSTSSLFVGQLDHSTGQFVLGRSFNIVDTSTNEQLFPTINSITSTNGVLITGHVEDSIGNLTAMAISVDMYDSSVAFSKFFTLNGSYNFSIKGVTFKAGYIITSGDAIDSVTAKTHGAAVTFDATSGLSAASVLTCKKFLPSPGKNTVSNFKVMGFNESGLDDFVTGSAFESSLHGAGRSVFFRINPYTLDLVWQLGISSSFSSGGMLSIVDQTPDRFMTDRWNYFLMPNLNPSVYLRPIIGRFKSTGYFPVGTFPNNYGYFTEASSLSSVSGTIQQNSNISVQEISSSTVTISSTSYSDIQILLTSATDIL